MLEMHQEMITDQIKEHLESKNISLVEIIKIISKDKMDRDND